MFLPLHRWRCYGEWDQFLPEVWPHQFGQHGFQMVKVDEPDDDTACLMLRGLKSRYAEHHNVHITDDAVKAAVTLSRRYLTGRQLPDKAIDLLDTAAALLSPGTGSFSLARAEPSRQRVSVDDGQRRRATRHPGAVRVD